MNPYWSAYALIMGTFMFGLVGPGPDFVMIIRNSAANTRKSGILTACGLGTGIFLHASYAMFGLGIILVKSALAINIIKYCGAAYITYIGSMALLGGVKGLRAKKATSSDVDIKAGEAKGMSNWQAFRMGFVTNILNPHAATFILSLILTAQGSPMIWQFSYGASMAFSAVLWYGFVAVFLTNKLLRERFLSVRHIIDLIAGCVLIGLAVRLALSKIAVLGS